MAAVPTVDRDAAIDAAARLLQALGLDTGSDELTDTPQGTAPTRDP